MTDFYERYPMMISCRGEIEKTIDLMEETYRKGGKIAVCGNGGSCADAEHIVGELMKGFLSLRKIPVEDREKIRKNFPDDADKFEKCLQRGIPAINLASQSGVFTAYANDVDAEMVYAQLVYACVKENDLLLGISTSGNSKNVVNALKVAKSFGIKTVGLTGEKPSEIEKIADCVIKAPESETYKIQEFHLPIYHYICIELEKRLFSE